MRKAQILLPLLTAFPIYAGQSVTWLQQYLAIDTVNPRAMNSGESPSWQIFLKKQISYSKRPNLLPAGETSGHALRGVINLPLYFCTILTLSPSIENIGTCHRYPAKSGATASMAVALLISRVLAFLSSHRFLR